MYDMPSISTNMKKNKKQEEEGEDEQKAHLCL